VHTELSAAEIGLLCSAKQLGPGTCIAGLELNAHAT
jgi:hypothetical protein